MHIRDGLVNHDFFITQHFNPCLPAFGHLKPGESFKLWEKRNGILYLKGAKYKTPKLLIHFKGEMVVVYTHDANLLYAKLPEGLFYRKGEQYFCKKDGQIALFGKDKVFELLPNEWIK